MATSDRFEVEPTEENGLLALGGTVAIGYVPNKWTEVLALVWAVVADILRGNCR